VNALLALFLFRPSRRQDPRGPLFLACFPLTTPRRAWREVNHDRMALPFGPISTARVWSSFCFHPSFLEFPPEFLLYVCWGQKIGSSLKTLFLQVEQFPPISFFSSVSVPTCRKHRNTEQPYECLPVVVEDYQSFRKVLIPSCVIHATPITLGPTWSFFGTDFKTVRPWLFFLGRKGRGKLFLSLGTDWKSSTPWLATFPTLFSLIPGAGVKASSSLFGADFSLRFL